MGKRKNLPPIGDPNDPRGFEVLIRRFGEWLTVQHRSKTSVENFCAGLAFFGRWCEERGISKPTEVTREVAERYQRWLFHNRRDNGRPLGLSTQLDRLGCVRSFFRWLTRERYLLYNPTAELMLPRKPPRLPVDNLSASEVEQVMRVPDTTTARGLRDRALLELLYATGLRRSELTNLDLYDVDQEHRWVVVRGGKGGADRVVPLGQRASVWVEHYVEEARPQLIARSDEQALFVSYHGVRFNPLALAQMVKGLLKASGVRPRRGACHLFRHTMATLMLEGGADVRFIQEMLGHVRLETTAIYTKVSIEKLAQIHAATHPGARLMAADGAHVTTREELLADLAAEAAAEAAEE